MANIIYRASLTPAVPSTNSVKNSPLSNLEIDGNFKSINNDLATKAASAHTHGDISSTGSIGSVQGLPIITGTDGKLVVGSFGNTSGSFCQGNDPRLGTTTSVAGGQAGSLLYQSAINTTNFIPVGTYGQVLNAGVSGTPSWTSSPTFITPALGTPVSGNLVNCTFPVLNQNTIGTSGQTNSVLSNEEPTAGQAIKFSKNAKTTQPTYIWGTTDDGSSSYIFDPATSLDVLKAATVESLGSQLLETNGYQKFPGGLVIQWGSYNDTTSPFSSLSTFPLAFTTVFTVVATKHDTANTENLVITYSNTYVRIIGDSIYDYNWIAIGYIAP